VNKEVLEDGANADDEVSDNSKRRMLNLPFEKFMAAEEGEGGRGINKYLVFVQPDR
jgi:hypothetical protein